MIEEKTDPLSICLYFKEINRHPTQFQGDDFNAPLKIFQDEAFFNYFAKIFESVKFASPPEIFQFYKLIFEDNSQLTFNNIKEYEVIFFLLQLLSMSNSNESVMKACLKIICILIECSNYIFIEFIQNDLLDILRDIYSYPSPKVQTLISRLYAIITDIDIDCATVFFYLRCTFDFLQQSIQWAACHYYESCRKDCLLFQYNVVVKSDKNIPMELIYYLSRSLLSILVSDNISLISLSAWTIGRLIQSYSLSFEMEDIFNCLFSTVQDQLLIDSEASVPILRMTIKALRFAEEIPSSEVLLPIIDWKILFQQMISTDHEISYLCCRVCQNLIQLGVDCINEVLSNGILDIACLIYEDCAFKSMCEISFLLMNIWTFGNIDQQKAIFCHRCFLLFLKFIEGPEMTESFRCFSAMYTSLKSITDIDQSFVSIFSEGVPSYFFNELLDHTNDDISNYSQIILDSFYPVEEITS